MASVLVMTACEDVRWMECCHVDIMKCHNTQQGSNRAVLAPCTHYTTGSVKGEFKFQQQFEMFTRLSTDQTETLTHVTSAPIAHVPRQLNSFALWRRRLSDLMSVLQFATCLSDSRNSVHKAQCPHPTLASQ